MAKLHPSLKNKEFWCKDITLIPNRLPDFERDEVDLTTNFTKKSQRSKIKIKIKNLWKKQNLYPPKFFKEKIGRESRLF
ncbi:hypothetical protein KKH59_01505 [Patescibacteria group bacterium]|nr:hypothetical protein [Patescibacteria group bacterium]